MRISKIVGNVKTSELDLITIEELLAQIVRPTSNLGDMWSPAIYRENYKNDKNWLCIPSLFVIDIDENLTLDAAVARLNGFGQKYAILPTRNNQKLKNDVICDRFRVVMFLSEPITRPDVFDATWDYVKSEMFPEADPSCKDEGRGYFYSTSVHAASSLGRLLEPVAPKPKAEVSLKPTILVKDLSKQTYKFLVNGAQKGERDLLVFKAASDFKANGIDEDTAVARICAAPIDYDRSFSETDVIKKVRSVYKRDGIRYPVSSANNDPLKNFLLSSILIQDVEDDRLPLAVNVETGARLAISLKTLPKALGKDFYTEYMSQKAILATYAYEPFHKSLLFTDDTRGVHIFNEYEPPFWEKAHFFKGESLPFPNQKPPEIVELFLKQIVDNDLGSYEYILDWVANAIRDRNLTILTAIGDEGIGKGTLGTLLCDIFGVSNFVKVRADVFKDKFNSQFENRRLVFLDELGLHSVAEYNRFKDVVNSEIELEKKGKDAKTIKNYASFFIASNDNKAIRPSPSDRRFSLINLSKTKLKDTALRNRLWELRDRKVIEDFVGYLLQRELQHDMLTPFKSENKSKEIAQAGLAEWEHYFIFEYLEDNINKQTSIRALGIEMKMACQLRSAPGRSRFEALCLKYPKYIRLVRIGNIRHVEIVGCPTIESVAQYEESKEEPTRDLKWSKH